jgi:hypothetical protein
VWRAFHVELLELNRLIRESIVKFSDNAFAFGRIICLKVASFLHLHGNRTSKPCGGHRALAPLKTDLFKDENGIMALVCCHGPVINFLFIRGTGEKFIYLILMLIEADKKFPGILIRIILAYDLICQLKPFMKVSFSSFFLYSRKTSELYFPLSRVSSYLRCMHMRMLSNA